jgi:hypothetical protein
VSDWGSYEGRVGGWHPGLDEVGRRFWEEAMAMATSQLGTDAWEL